MARAPGRVNLIGEHTDYNDGFVLPMALPFDTVVELSRRDDRTVVAESVGYESVTFELDDDPLSVPGWARYIAGMSRLVETSGVAVSGFDVKVQTTIPVGASLSSSAALEVATGFGLYGLAGATPEPVAIAKLGQRVENEIIGIQSGIMDQLIVAIAQPGAASMIDCRSLEATAVELPDTVSIVILDTMTRRELVDSEYDHRRESCERAAAAVGVTSLRDASLDMIENVPDATDRRRAHHVLTENQRVHEVVSALDDDDVESMGALMNASHESLRDDYEVSSPALDTMVEIAREHSTCLGARMTGGGFAGSAVALVDDEATTHFITHVRDRWVERFGVVPDTWPVKPAAGASVG